MRRRSRFLLIGMAILLLAAFLVSGYTFLSKDRTFTWQQLVILDPGNTKGDLSPYSEYTRVPVLIPWREALAPNPHYRFVGLDWGWGRAVQLEPREATAFSLAWLNHLNLPAVHPQNMKVLNGERCRIWNHAIEGWPPVLERLRICSALNNDHITSVELSLTSIPERFNPPPFGVDELPQVRYSCPSISGFADDSIRSTRAVHALLELDGRQLTVDLDSMFTYPKHREVLGELTPDGLPSKELSARLAQLASPHGLLSKWKGKRKPVLYLYARGSTPNKTMLALKDAVQPYGMMILVGCLSDVRTPHVLSPRIFTAWLRLTEAKHPARLSVYLEPNGFRVTNRKKEEVTHDFIPRLSAPAKTLFRPDLPLADYDWEALEAYKHRFIQESNGMWREFIFEGEPELPLSTVMLMTEAEFSLRP